MTCLVRRLVPIVAVVLLAADAPDSSGPAQPARYAVRWHAGGKSDPSWVEIAGIDTQNLDALARSGWDPARWASLFHVTVAPERLEGADEPPPVLGTYRVVDDALRFQPRFAWEPGLLHRARFRPSRLPRAAVNAPADVTTEFTRRAPRPTASAFVVRVDPSASLLPENLLKFYLHFSQPMSRGEAYHRVHLLDASGRKVELPFLELGEELWDPSGTRLTLLLDPGRIKRGLKPREEQGPILESGRSYALVVDRNWPDAGGQPLRSAYRKTFRAGPADETQPDPRTWVLESPRAGTDESLGLAFPEPLDRAMLDRVLAVHDPEGRIVPGRAEVNTAGTRWSFRPERPWRPGTYRVDVDTALEDLAGNSIARPFEVDVLRPLTRRTEPTTASLPFAIRGQGSD